MRLGKKAEQIFERKLKESGNYKILTKGLQIIENKITLGELDFIVLNLKTNKIIHIEYCYKFYLYDPSFRNELDKWIGPNRKDSYLQKLDKLKNKQLPLLYHPATQQTLEKLNIKVNSQQIHFDCQLYIPKYHNPSLIENKENPDGLWYYFEDFKVLFNANHKFHIPNKPEWIDQISTNIVWKTYNETLPEIEQYLLNKKSPLVWIKHSDDSLEKVFVVWWLPQRSS